MKTRNCIGLIFLHIQRRECPPFFRNVKAVASDDALNFINCDLHEIMINFFNILGKLSVF